MLCIRANAWQSIQFLLDGGLFCSLSVSVCMSLALSLPLLAGRSVCAAGRSDQNKNSNTRHRRGNKAKWSTEPECLPSHNYVELFPFFTLPLLLFFPSLFETSGLVVISQKRIKPADRERGGAFWSEMANRNILLLFCGLFLLALIQPSLQGGKCITAGEWSHNYCCIKGLEQVQKSFVPKLKILSHQNVCWCLLATRQQEVHIKALYNN